MELESQLKNWLIAKARARGREVTDIAPHDGFFQTNLLDSLALLDFVMFIERDLGIAIPGEDILPENFENLEALMNYLSQRQLATGR